MNAKTSTLTTSSAARAAPTVTAIPLCRINRMVASYPLGVATPRVSRTFLGKTSYQGGGTHIPFQLNATMVAESQVTPVADALDRMKRNRDGLSLETVVVELAAPSLSPDEVKSERVDLSDLPAKLPVTLHIVALDERHGDVASWLQHELPKAHLKAVFLVAWASLEMQKLRHPCFEMRGWALPELDALVVFDADMLTPLTTYLDVKDGVAA